MQRSHRKTSHKIIDIIKNTFNYSLLSTTVIKDFQNVKINRKDWATLCSIKITFKSRTRYSNQLKKVFLRKIFN